jgi:O-antigen ligase
MLAGTMFSFFLIACQRTITLTDFLVISFILVITFSSLLNGTDVKEWTYLSLSICCIYFSFNFYQDNLTPLIIGLALGFSTAVFAQFYQLVTQPELWINPEKKEVTSYMLGGNYNQMGVRLLITLVLDILCIKKRHDFYFLLIPCIIACMSIPIMVGSMTAVTCIILFLLLCIIPSHRLRQMSILGLFAAVILFQLLVCFNGKGIEDNDLMVWFIEDVLDKDITFTYRTYMWDSALRIIIQSPVIGYGYPDADWYMAHMSSFAIGPHNIILAILIYGGVISISLYLFFILRSFTQLQVVQDYWSDVLLIGIAVLSMMMLMEAYHIGIVFTFFVLAEYYPLLHLQLTAKADE